MILEVLKTSEELERQILEDARKKARRVLELAEKESADIRAEWEKKAGEEAVRMEADSGRKIAALRAELAASLPLDRMRERLSFIEKTVDTELTKCINALSAAEQTTVFSTLIKRVAPVFAGKRVMAYTNGIGEPELRPMLKAAIPSATVIGIQPLTDAARNRPADLLPRDPRGLILETEDRRIRYRGTFDEMIRRLMDEDRDALVAALFGKDI
jgi:V/A-type H+/Na+-transporting ATPase subunit E